MPEEFLDRANVISVFPRKRPPSRGFTKRRLQQIVSQLRFQKSSSRTTLQVSFSSKRIRLFQICLVVNKLPRPAMRGREAFAMSMLSYSCPQILRVTNIEPRIALRSEDVNVKHSALLYWLSARELSFYVLVLGRGRHVFFRRQVSEKSAHFLCSHFGRMTLPIEQNEALDPIDVGRFGASAIMLETQGRADFIQQS